MDLTPLGNTDHLKPKKQTKLPNAINKSSIKSSEDKVTFKLDDYFVDDYHHHYPIEDLRYVCSYTELELSYSLCELD